MIDLPYILFMYIYIHVAQSVQVTQPRIRFTYYLVVRDCLSVAVNIMFSNNNNTLHLINNCHFHTC